jgi:hypothetical protein
MWRKKMEKKLDKLENTKQVKTLIDKIWDDIKDKPLEMFALPQQFVHMYCEPITIEPTKLYLKYKVPAVLPALEEVLKNKYIVERANKYICISPIKDK